MTLALLTQPRFLWAWFNPVSFWMVIEGDRLLAVIAEVNNTFGQRHCYLCRNAGFVPIDPQGAITTDKVFHVSPFQDVQGAYTFNFSLRPDGITIRIRQTDADEGLDAAMSGRFAPLTSTTVLGACLRRPVGPIRILALIHWHALRLRLKGATYRRLPSPPQHEIT